ncbi:MAG: hypothetical protein GX595_15405 [Lentisphaerae bacterium]|nr:hypothetical protein [Lentisphaerota bacterium]
MKPVVLIGSSIPPGLEQVRLHQRLKLGDLVLTSLPRDLGEARAVADFCRREDLHLCFGEFVYRGSGIPCPAWRETVGREAFFSKADIDAVLDAAGAAYFGRLSIGEAGGILYWPEAYLRRTGPHGWRTLEPCDTHDQAAAAYVALCRRLLEAERRDIGRGPLLDVDSSFAFKYHAMAGVDKLCLESMPGDPHRMHAAVRGAARAYAKPWGTHIAMGWYGGVTVDAMFQKRWKNALLHAYLAGAEFIYPESGHYTCDNPRRGLRLGFHSKPMKAMRRTLREAWQFARLHTRPAGGPEVRLGILHGQHDGAPGLWNPVAWGQYHDPKWLEGPAERGWNLLDGFHRSEDWPKATVQGDLDVSGNPPLGQYDLVPAEADAACLQRYSALVCLGWNTMTADLYERLRAYVEAGGHLLMFLPQVSTRTDRAAEPALFRDGDLADLFGVRIRGREATAVQGVTFCAESGLPGYRTPLYRVGEDPLFLGRLTPARVELAGARVLSGFAGLFATAEEALLARPAVVEHRLGRGCAMLVTAWEFPGDDGLRPLSEDLLRMVLQGEQGDLRLLGSDRVRYAVYRGQAPGRGRRYRLAYLLNTAADVPAPVRLWHRGRLSAEVTIAANDLRLAYLAGDLLVVPSDRRVDLAAWAGSGARHDLRLFSPVEQTVLACNLGRKALRVTLHGNTAEIAPGASLEMALPRTVDPERQRFAAPDFLEEPRVRYRHDRLPY